jgi:predicted GNAT family acetyltransferase
MDSARAGAEGSPPGVDAAVEIADRPERSRYEVSVGGQLAGVVTYKLADGEIAFIHTEIDRAFAGRGLGSRVAAYVLDDARARNLGVRPLCPFIRRYIRSHPAYQDLVKGSS